MERLEVDVLPDICGLQDLLKKSQGTSLVTHNRWALNFQDFQIGLILEGHRPSLLRHVLERPAIQRQIEV